MKSNKLICLFFPELMSWERLAPRALLDGLSKSIEFEVIEASDANLASVREASRGASVWALSRDWRKAMRWIKRAELQATRVIYSALGHSPEEHNFLELFWKVRGLKLGRQDLILSHTPLSRRIFQELEGLEEDRVRLLPLPFKELSTPKRLNGDRLTIGTLTDYSDECNLNFLCNIAHYVIHRSPAVRFKVLGSGGLYSHFYRMIRDLELENFVELSEVSDYEDLSSVDVFLYFPIRNSHFCPLLVAAAYGIPVIATEMPGIEGFISDGQSGFCLPIHETKPMGELLVRLIDDSRLRSHLGKAFQKRVSENYSLENLVPRYAELFFDPPRESQKKVEAA